MKMEEGKKMKEEDEEKMTHNQEVEEECTKKCGNFEQERCKTKKKENDAFGVKVIISRGDNINKKPKFIGFETLG